MGKVFFYVTMSLDGFMAPEQRGDDVGDRRWMSQWGRLQKHLLAQEFLRENLKLGTGGQAGAVNRFLEETFERTGASVMGKRMFDAGEAQWPEEAPFHTPVYVLTRKVREPWERPGGTTFRFVNDGLESALRQAKEAAGSRDVRIAGGAHVIRGYLEAGLVDEFTLGVPPVLLGGGTRLFDLRDGDRISLELLRTLDDPQVTHLTYAVKRA
jgi:dihydrofolate reductase